MNLTCKNLNYYIQDLNYDQCNIITQTHNYEIKNVNYKIKSQFRKVIILNLIILTFYVIT